MARRTASEDEPSPESPVQSQTSQEEMSSRDPSPKPAPAPKYIRSRLKIEKQVELIEICTRWILQYMPDKNGGKAFWDKVHEVFESTGSKYSADSCKIFIQGRMGIYDQQAPVEKELEEPLHAWMLAVDRRREEEKQRKMDKKQADKKKADKKKADKEKADKEKAEKKKSEKEKDTTRSDSKKPVAPKKPNDEAGPSKKLRVLAPRTNVPDSEEDLDKSKEDTSIPSIESDQLPNLPKRGPSNVSPVGEPSPKKPRTRSFTTQTEGRPTQDKGKARATSLQPGTTHRGPSAPGAKPEAKPEAKPTATKPIGEKRKRPAPKASVDDAPEPSTRSQKKAKTTNGLIKERADGLEGHLNRIEENIGGKFQELKHELEGLKSEVTNLNDWHVQLNDAINHEQGISIKQSAVEVSKTSAVVVNTTASAEVTEQSPGSGGSEGKDGDGAGVSGDAEPTTQGARLETIHEITETSISGVGRAPRPDATTPVSSGDDPASSPSEEDEDVSTAFV